MRAIIWPAARGRQATAISVTAEMRSVSSSCAVSSDRQTTERDRQSSGNKPISTARSHLLTASQVSSYSATSCRSVVALRFPQRPALRPVTRHECYRKPRQNRTHELESLNERPSATRALAFKTIDQRPKGRRLRQRHDGLESQRSTVGVMPVGDSADRVAENLDRGFWDMLVVVSRACFAQIFQHPRCNFAGLEVGLGLDTGEIA